MYSIGYVIPMTKATNTLKAGTRAMFLTDTPEEVTIVRGTYVGTERWLVVESATRGRFTTHPDHLAPIVPLADVLAAYPVRAA